MYAYALRTPHSAHGLTVTPDTGSRAEGRHTIARGGEATHTHTQHTTASQHKTCGAPHTRYCVQALRLTSNNNSMHHRPEMT